MWNSTCLQHDELRPRSTENYPPEVHSAPYGSQSSNIFEETYDSFGIVTEIPLGGSSLYNDHETNADFRRHSMNHATGVDNTISIFSLSNRDNRRLLNADFRRHSLNNGIRPHPNNAYI